MSNSKNVRSTVYYWVLLPQNSSPTVAISFTSLHVCCFHNNNLLSIYYRVYFVHKKSYDDKKRATFHSLTEPSSLHEANRPLIHGFQLSPFTSNVFTLATAINDGWSTSVHELSSANICMESSPPAEAMRPVNRHLINTKYTQEVQTANTLSISFSINILYLVH